MEIRARRSALAGLAAAVVALGSAAGATAQEGCQDRFPVERTSMELRGADIPTTLRLLAQRYRVNLLLTEEVGGTVTLSFFDVPVREVFATLIEATELRCVPRDGVLQVSSAARFLQQEEDRIKREQARIREEAETRKLVDEAEKAQRDRERARFEEELLRAQAEEVRARGPLREETIRLRYADAEDVAKTLQGILGIPETGVPAPTPGIYAPPPPTVIADRPGAPPAPAFPPPPPPGAPPAPAVLVQGLTIRAHKATNSVFIRYYANDLERIRKLVTENLDVPLPQVQIAAQIVITDRNALEQIGVQWGGSIVARGAPRRGTLVGTGLAQQVDPTTGIALPPGETTSVVGTQPNPAFTPGMPVDPVSGLATGGNLVNLPLAFLPTAANPALGLLFGIVSRNFNINLAIQALEVQGRARSISEPKIVTVENAKAVISRGFEVPFVSQTGFGGTQVQFKDALLKLEVTPSVIDEPDGKRIKMRVLVEDNNPDFTRQVQGNPPIFKRMSESEVVVREGERLVIGGVLVETETTTNRQVPVLGRIPLLGWLFKAREIQAEGQELIIVITPSVIPTSTAAR